MGFICTVCPLFFMLFVDLFKVAKQNRSETALATPRRVSAICTNVVLSSVSTYMLLSSTLAGLHSSGSSDVGLCYGCSYVMVVDCCLVLDLRQLLIGPSTSVGVAGVTVVSVGSSSCFTGLIGWFWSLCMVVEVRYVSSWYTLLCKSSLIAEFDVVISTLICQFCLLHIWICFLCNPWCPLGCHLLSLPCRFLSCIWVWRLWLCGHHQDEVSWLHWRFHWLLVVMFLHVDYLSLLLRRCWATTW